MALTSKKYGFGESWKDIKASNQLFSILFDRTSDAIFITNSEGKFADINSEAENITGYSRKELLNMSFLNLFNSVDIKTFPLFFNCVRSEEEVASKVTVERKDGSHLCVKANNNKLGEGTNVFMSTVIREH